MHGVAGVPNRSVTPCGKLSVRTKGVRLSPVHSSNEYLSRFMIYFVKAYNKFVKIGTSVDIDSRVASLQTGSPVTLKVAAILDGSFQTESGLHALFEHVRYNGEWFRLTDELKWFIIAIQLSPNENNIYTLYRKSLQLRLKNKAKRLGNKHKLSKRIKRICEV